jgi:hypothetical protein
VFPFVFDDDVGLLVPSLLNRGIETNKETGNMAYSERVKEAMAD